jgi:hypothetical protein
VHDWGLLSRMSLALITLTDGEFDALSSPV